MSETVAETDARGSVEAWARAGAMALTGPRSGPGLGPPASLVPRLARVADVFRRRSGEVGTEVALDPLVLLTERAAIAGLSRNGQTSCGGAARLLPSADGWLAVSLARADDVDLVPAWLGVDVAVEEPWEVVAQRVATQTTDSLVAQGRLLGLPVSGLHDRFTPAGSGRPCVPSAAPVPAPLHTSAELSDLPCRAVAVDGHGHEAPASIADVVVADLSSLWAGPLCGSLLSDAGATVIKVESTTRPDGAREGPADFFDLLNGGKRSVAVDLSGEHGRQVLRSLLARVDVVIEASRPRALAQLGVDANELLVTARPRVWVSITGHGRDRPDLVGFGDDAAVAGGLIAWDGGQPFFCGDAIADPISGLVAAAAVLETLAFGGSWLLDVSLSTVAAHLAGPTLDVPPSTTAAAPSRRPPRGRGPVLGRHTAEVLAQVGLER